MKIKLKIFRSVSLFLAGVMVLCTSCLKENEYTYFDFASVGTQVELPLSAYLAKQTLKVQALSYGKALTSVDLPIGVNIASPEPLGSALDVTLTVDAAALAAFNTANPTLGYTLLPTTAYTAGSLKVSIPAGQRLAYATVKINPSAITDNTKKYVLPISISDAGGQKISNYKTVYYFISVK